MDDPLDAFAVHGACGMWGILLSALLTTPHCEDFFAGLPGRAGLFYGGGHLLGATACTYTLLEAV